MSVEIENSNSASGDASVSSGHQAAAAAAPAVKKKRNLPGMPDPDAEVIALSPNTLMATNRFVCEICSKGFQRDQNLQLHRRGHNLPWKLRQRTGNAEEARKRVYVCPEGSCLHHHPSRALGDLTGIKKHFFRKHGEKKWKCDKCTKKYAVHSDWKAHSKTCGTREYRCACGTLFSRRDSFVTHRSFCNALVVESAKGQPSEVAIAAATAVTIDDVATDQQDPANATGIKGNLPTAATSLAVSSSAAGKSNTVISSEADIFVSYARSTAAQGACFSDPIRDRSIAAEAEAMGPTSLCLTTSTLRSVAPPPPPPHMSATALLQKAAQIGATVSKASFLTGFGLQWSPHNQQQVDPASLGIGLPYDGGEPPPGLFLPKPSVTTLDFLGLGIGMGTVGPSKGGLSALIGGALDMDAAPAVHYGTGSSPERNPSSPAIL